jgi:Tetratricopeptide repeat
VGPYGRFLLRSHPRGAGLLLVASVLSLAGCQQAMSVEEAKKVTVQFAETGFVPPPRTIADITAILDQQKRADPDVTARARAQADAAPPATANPSELSRFYYQRALSARAIGRSKQEIEDLRQALANVRPTFKILQDLSKAENRGGYVRRAIQSSEQAIALVPYSDRTRTMGPLSRLTTFYVAQGDFKAAEGALAEIERFHAEAMRSPNLRPETHAEYDASLAEAKAVLQEATGRLAEAAGFYREAAAALAANPIRVSNWTNEEYAYLSRVRVQQGRLLEAETEARRALLGTPAKYGRYSTYTAWVLSYLIEVIMEQGRYAEAEALARARIDILEQTGTVPESSTLNHARGQLAVALGFQRRWDNAMALYEKMRADLAADPEYAKQFLGGRGGYGMALLRTGQFDQALPVFNVALERSIRQFGRTHPNTGRVRGLIGEVYAGKGDQASALREFREAIPLLLARGATDAADESSTRSAADDRTASVLETYIALLAEIRGTALERDTGIDAAAEAFRLAEVVRGRAVQGALDASAARTVAQTPALADLVRRN